MTLPLLHKRTPRKLRHRCTECGKLDSDGTSGPGHIEERAFGYALVLGPWLCRTHSRKRWAAYLAVVRERMALIRASEFVGYPMTATQYREWCEHENEQLPMWQRLGAA